MDREGMGKWGFGSPYPSITCRGWGPRKANGHSGWATLTLSSLPGPVGPVLSERSQPFPAPLSIDPQLLFIYTPIIYHDSLLAVFCFIDLAAFPNEGIIGRVQWLWGAGWI